MALLSFNTLLKVLINMKMTWLCWVRNKICFACWRIELFCKALMYFGIRMTPASFDGSSRSKNWTIAVKASQF